MKRQSTRGAQTKLRILQVAADLFHKQGIRATSPDEIIAVSGTGKGQFYHYFKNKQGLVHEVLMMHLEAIKKGKAPLNYDIRSWEDLTKWFTAHIELQKRFQMVRGCPFGTVVNELTEDDELIRQDMGLIFQIIKTKLAAFFLTEQAKGKLSAGANPEDLADFCIAVVQGAMLMGKVNRDSKPAEITVGEAISHLKRYAVTAP